jgi:hypothetical protein
MIFIEMRPIPPLELESETYQWTKTAFGHPREPGPKNLLKSYMKVKSKEASWHWKFGRGEKARQLNNETHRSQLGSKMVESEGDERNMVEDVSVIDQQKEKT